MQVSMKTQQLGYGLASGLPVFSPVNYVFRLFTQNPRPSCGFMFKELNINRCFVSFCFV